MPTVRVNERWDLVVPEHRVQHWLDNPMWEAERLDSIHANVKPGDVVYDVGAEQGDFSALFGTWVCAAGSGICRACGHVAPPGAAEYREEVGMALCAYCRREEWEPLDGSRGGVVCVEPAYWYWPTIRATLDANEVRFVGGLHGFCGSEPSVGLELQPTWPAASEGEMTGQQGFSNIKGTRQPVATIDALAAAYGPPNAISVDVEGAEILVMAGAQGVLAQARPLVWVSVHPEMMFNDHGIYEQEFHSTLHRHGYEKAHLAFDHEHHWFYYPGERRDEVVLP